MWSESARLAASEEKDDAVVQVVLEQILGHNRVNHQLEAAAACRVNHINYGVEIELFDPLSVHDPLSRRNSRVPEARRIHNDQVLGHLALICLRILCAAGGQIARRSDLPADKRIDHGRFADSHLAHDHDSSPVALLQLYR